MLESSSAPKYQQSQSISVSDAVVLEKLIRSYFAILCRFAENFLPDASLAKDVVQESFIKIWNSGKSFDSEEGVKAYLYVTTRNGCLDLLKSRSRIDSKHRDISTRIELATNSILPTIIHAEYVAQVYQLVKKMPLKMQQVFFLSYREGMTVSEIAAHLEMNVKSIKKQKYKALVLIRKRLAHHQQPLVLFLAAVTLINDLKYFSHPGEESIRVTFHFLHSDICRNQTKAIFYTDRLSGLPA